MFAPPFRVQMALHPDVLQRRKPKSGLCACLQTENDEPSSHETSMAGPGHLPLFADMDSLKAYPHLLHELIHKSHLVSKVGSVPLFWSQCIGRPQCNVQRCDRRAIQPGGCLSTKCTPSFGMRQHFLALTHYLCNRMMMTGTA